MSSTLTGWIARDSAILGYVSVLCVMQVSELFMEQLSSAKKEELNVEKAQSCVCVRGVMSRTGVLELHERCNGDSCMLVICFHEQFLIWHSKSKSCVLSKEGQ